MMLSPVARARAKGKSGDEEGGKGGNGGDELAEASAKLAAINPVFAELANGASLGPPAHQARRLQVTVVSHSQAGVRHSAQFAVGYVLNCRWPGG